MIWGIQLEQDVEDCECECYVKIDVCNFKEDDQKSPQ